jgi:DNA-binding GntR family transcriptional regulator
MPEHRRQPRSLEARLVKGESPGFAYTELRRDILSLALKPGSTLDEASLVLRLGLSRTPVREALVRLAAEGLVTLLPNRGATVASMSWDDIRENLEALDVAQRLTTRWAALRRSEADLDAIRAERDRFERLFAARDTEAMTDCNWHFHAAIAASCRNRTVVSFYLRVLTDNLRVSRLAMGYECFADEAAWRAHLDAIVAEHNGMVEAITRRDANRAEALAFSHTNLARKRVVETLTQSLTPDMRLILNPDGIASTGGSDSPP